MAIGLIFWIIMLILLVFGAYNGRTAGQPFNWAGFGGSFIIWILLALLGWDAFGPMIKG